MDQFGFISGRRVSHFGPRDGRFWPFLGVPRRPILVNSERQLGPFWLTQQRKDGEFSVKFEAVGGPILVHFGPPSQPLWAPGRPIFANFGHYSGAKTPDFGQPLNGNTAHVG